MAGKKSGAMAILGAGLTEAELNDAMKSTPVRRKPHSGAVNTMAETTPEAKGRQDSKVKDAESSSSYAAQKLGSSEYDPARCYEIATAEIIPWKHADRPKEGFGDMESFVRSIQVDGQHQPVLLRPCEKIETPDGTARYELIYGHRRFLACKTLGIPVRAFVREMTDQQAFSAMTIENSQRLDISSYSRAISYRRALGEGLYSSPGALAAACSLDRTTVRDILYYMDLPSSVRETVDLHNVSIRTVKEMRRVLRDEPEMEQVILDNAEKIASPNFGPTQFKSLKPKPPVVKKQSETITDRRGVKLFSVSETANGSLNFTVLPAAREKLTKEQVVAALETVISSNS